MIRYILAIMLISFGVALALENIGVIDISVHHAWLYIYPIIFMIFGFKWIADRVRHRGGSWIFGSFFFIFGILLLMDRFDFITFQFGDVLKLWPLLIVYIGFTFIGSSKRMFVHRKVRTNMNHTDDTRFFSVGDQEYNRPNWKVEPMHLRRMAGDFYLDFSKAFIPEKEIPTTINSLAVDVHILMPENIAFRVEATVMAGEITAAAQKKDGINRTITYETPDYEKAIQKLNLFIKLQAGSIRVVNI
ncbi:lia operon protein LiaF [Lentibacillus halodurans]|uniref:Lia operon protein LiaF n=1 Tax=Lentibacillus halodurans TaxID=237679 RepID=A0A1I0W0F2_9BACI|nr:cell wall-active antibiotics response protein LiaF [Lentibacillus halodurans]SFA81613.1 lia operon protein LiaF [Lentibacillus halodurans]